MENVGNKKVLVFITLSTKEEMQFLLTDERLKKMLDCFLSDSKSLFFNEENIFIAKRHIVKIFITE